MRRLATAPWGPLPVTWALALLSAVALVAHAQIPPRDAPSSRIGTARIRGRVVADDDTGAAIRNARVSLTSQDGTIPTVLADGEGRFTITALPAGRYSLSATKPGYVKAMWEGRPGNLARAIDVAAGAMVDGIEIRMAKGGAISGRVVDDLGDPLPNVTVAAELIGRDSGSRGEPVRPAAVRSSAQTNDLGEYRIGGLAEGAFIVSVDNAVALYSTQGSTFVIDIRGSSVINLQGSTFVTAPGAGGDIFIRRDDTSRTYYPGVTALADAQAISVSRGEERSAIDVIMPVSRQLSASVRTTDAARGSISADAGAIRGRILRADGRPLGRARIRLAGVKSFSVRVTESEDDGSYEFPRVAPDDYTVSASKSGFVDAAFGQRGPILRIATVKVEPGKARENIDITLSPYGAIEGRLLDENGDPIEGARVRALQLRFAAGRQRLVDVPQIQPGLTDDRGRYRLSGVRPGEYFVSSLIGQVMTPMRIADVPGYAPAFFPGTGNAAEARAVTVGPSQLVSDADFVVQRTTTARIAGIALKSNGDGVGGNLTMRASERSGAVDAIAVGARIGRDGTFEFPNVAPGEYVIRAAQDRRNNSTEGEFGSLFVNVTGTDVTGLVLRTSPGSTISGHITIDGTASITPGSIDLTPVPIDPDRSAPQTARAAVHDDWTFDIGGINGPRRLRLVDAPGRWALKAIYLNGVDVTDTALPFGTASQSISGLEVVLTDHVTEIFGRTTDGSGRPVPLPPSSVIAFSVDRERWDQNSRFIKRGTSWTGGRFGITGLPPGEYFIAAVARPAFEDERQDAEYLDSISRQAARILLTEGQAVVIDPKLISR